jgi:hypothetical protein
VGAYSVLVYSGQRSLPALRLVTASDTLTASAIADDLLAQSPSGVGVEVVCNGMRLYARGVVPIGGSRHSWADASAGGVEAASRYANAGTGGAVSRSRANLRT